MARGLGLRKATLRRLEADLPQLSDRVVAAIIEEVPSYSHALSGPMGANIRQAVRLALSGFIAVAGRWRGEDSPTPQADVVDGAYQLGRGEARSGRTADALLSAYRIGARVSWRELSARTVEEGADPETVSRFATLVFAYIDELSAASVAGHTDELATSGRLRERLLERLARSLLDGADASTVQSMAERAGWEPGRTLTAVLVPDSQARTVTGALHVEPLQVADVESDRLVLLVPDAGGSGRTALLRLVRDRGAVVGPARPWLAVRTSYERARRVLALGLGPDTEQHLTDLVLTADEEAYADLRECALAPLAELTEASRDKLMDTLRAWLLHLGRREDVAAALFVHPQTVRYRMTQLRELYGDRLEDPDTVRDLVVALGREGVGAGA